jgi:GcrA cell cycle regulator
MTRRPPPQREGVTAWADDADQVLREMWAADIKAADIGAKLGRTRNSVIGRARRLGLQARPSPIGQRPPGAPPRKRKPGRPRIPDMQRAARIAARRAANPIPAAQPAPSGDPAPVRSTGLVDAPCDLPRPVLPAGGSSAGRCCRWPMWGNKERPTHRYCGAPVSWRRDGTLRAYCAEHAARAFTDRAERDPDHVVTRATFAWGGVRA